MKVITVILLLMCFSTEGARSQADSTQLYYTRTGQVRFISEAPLELISAESREMQGVIDMSNRTFAFAVQMNSLKGFNSPLQREHFNENYLETSTYHKASFSGRILDDVDLTADGTHPVRVKGTLLIHGIEMERIIDGLITSSNGELSIEAGFSVLLEDHNISIPRIMYQKIAEIISVFVSATLQVR